MDATTSSGSGPRDALPGARHALILLLLINLFNYIDRQVLSAVLPKLESEFTPNDPNAKAKMGALTTAFMVAYMVIAPLFGWLGDRVARWKLIGVGVILWSIATGASGLAAGFVMLLMTRCFVGVGEGAYGPVAPGVIADLYPVERRGSVLAWFYMAIPVGSALGFAIGGGVAATAWGWRGAFLVVVLPGLLLGLWCFRMPEPPRGQTDQVKSDRKGSWRDYRVLAKTPSYVLDTLGMTAMTFVLGGVAAFMPTYVYEREGRFAMTAEAIVEFQKKAKPDPDFLERLRPLVHAKDEEGLSHKQMTRYLHKHLPQETLQIYNLKLLEASETKDSYSLFLINIIFGGIVVLSGLFATLLGGIAGDRLRSRFSGSYFLVSGVGMLLAFPLFVLILVVDFPWAWVLMFAAVFCLFFNTGPTNTVLANVSPPSIRASAFALNILIIHAFGDAISPFIIGILADSSSLSHAFFCISFLIPVSGVMWLWGARYLAADTARAPHRLV